MVQIMSSVPGFSFRIKFQGLVPGFRVPGFRVTGFRVQGFSSRI